MVSERPASSSTRCESIVLSSLYVSLYVFFFFNDTATTEIYTLSLHDALPICFNVAAGPVTIHVDVRDAESAREVLADIENRSEEHTSELQSRLHLVCRLLLEKKKNNIKHRTIENCTHEHCVTSLNNECTDAAC